MQLQSKTGPAAFLSAGANIWSVATVIATFISAGGVHTGNATGFYGPQVYLDDGGANLLRSTEFYWDTEVKRLARNFKPSEKRIPIRDHDGEEVLPSEETTRETINGFGAEMTASADTQDFAAALKEGRLKPADPAQATAENEAARKVIAADNDTVTDPLPAEFPSEFADYHKGALAYKLGETDEAIAAWNTLLNRPADERHYRSVWAAFMLGKVALKRGDPAAAKWFELTRELAKTGFVDSLGLAADSYGWEGRNELRQDHPAKAAELFLTQLALGDEGAVVSLKALIPDRTAQEGMLNNFGSASTDDSSQPTDEQQKEEAAKTLVFLKEAAKDPLLRQLETAHILATALADDDQNGAVQSETKGENSDRFTRWLSVLTETHIDRLENADHVGWIAYSKGDYKAAERWLKLADPESPTALWLSAKLLRRAGKLDEATKVMVRAQKAIVPISNYTHWSWQPDNDGGNGSFSFGEQASGDLGALQLEQSQFIPALETLFNGGGKLVTSNGQFLGGLWDDAAFVAERILTTDELKAFVDRQPVPQLGANQDGGDDPTVRLRYLLGRRLVREDRYKEAAQYLKPPYDKLLAEYVKALEAGGDEKLSKRERAQAWFKAAWLARYDGMELMGTEGAPDGFSAGGDFEVPDLAEQQLTGFYGGESPDTDEKTEKKRIVLKPSKEDLQRLSKTKTNPDLRFHYRVIAGALAVRAAGLLQDNTEELADVLNAAGQWVKDRDEKIGDRYYQILKTRAPKTKIGSLVLAKHWFVNENGPWSDEQREAEAKLHKDLGIPTE